MTNQDTVVIHRTVPAATAAALSQQLVANYCHFRFELIKIVEDGIGTDRQQPTALLAVTMMLRLSWLSALDGTVPVSYGCQEDIIIFIESRTRKDAAAAAGD